MNMLGFDLPQEEELIDLENNGKKRNIDKNEKDDTKSIFGVDVKTNRSVYGGAVVPVTPAQIDNYHDPAVAETRVFGSYSSENPMAGLYRKGETTDSSSGYDRLRISMKGRRNVKNLSKHMRQAGF